MILRLRTLLIFLGGSLAVAFVLSTGVSTKAVSRSVAGDFRAFVPGLAADSAPGTSQDRTVTLADDGGTVQLRPGDSFLLDLGADSNWTVDVADPAILSRVPNIAVVAGAQGVYRAHKPGTTTLTATGTPICAIGEPCPLYIRQFRLTVVVG